MTASRLASRQVEKLWGRAELPQSFGMAAAGPIGEVWFQDGRGGEAELLVKYLLTREKLSIQVHPDGEAARAAGHRRGKDEAWLVLDAEPGATIGLGLNCRVDREELRAAALSGEIEQLLDWRIVAPGDIFYSPAGTVHAIGAGLSVIEIQQNCDVTYRLYDYGRPRELQLDEAVAVARPEPWSPERGPREAGNGRSVHVEGGHFVLERWAGARAVALDDAVTLVPVVGSGMIDGRPFEAGTVWMTDGSARLELAADADLLVAYSGSEARDFQAV